MARPSPAQHHTRSRPKMMVTSRRPWGTHLLVAGALAVISISALGGSLGPGAVRAISLNGTDSLQQQQPKHARHGRAFGMLSGTRDRDETGDTTGQNTSVTLYKEPSGWLVNILKELFSDIDWQQIDKARVQIEKFIQKVDRIVGSFRSIISKAAGGGSGGPGGFSANDLHSRDGRWWSGSADKSTGALKGDATRVKEMLERVACFVGYVRLMNLSNEALAELDASKVVSNLFGSGGAGGGAKRNSSVWSWFG